MEKQLRTRLTLVFAIATFGILQAVTVVKSSVTSTEVNNLETATVTTDFSKLTIADYEKLSGKKRSFIQKVQFKLAQKYAVKMPTEEKSSKKTSSLLSLILGIGSFVLLLVPFYVSITAAVVGLFLGIRGLRKENARTMATWGIVLSGLLLLLMIGLIILANNFSFT